MTMWPHLSYMLVCCQQKEVARTAIVSHFEWFVMSFRVLNSSLTNILLGSSWACPCPVHLYLWQKIFATFESSNCVIISILPTLLQTLNHFSAPVAQLLYLQLRPQLEFLRLHPISHSLNRLLQYSCLQTHQVILIWHDNGPHHNQFQVQWIISVEPPLHATLLEFQAPVYQPTFQTPPLLHILEDLTIPFQEARKSLMKLDRPPCLISW